MPPEELMQQDRATTAVWRESRVQPSSRLVRSAEPNGRGTGCQHPRTRESEDRRSFSRSATKRAVIARLKRGIQRGLDGPSNPVATGIVFSSQVRLQPSGKVPK